MTRDSGQSSVLALGVMAVVGASLFGLLRLGEVVVDAARAQAVADAVALAEARSDDFGSEWGSMVARANGASSESGIVTGLGWAVVVVDTARASARATAPTP